MTTQETLVSRQIGRVLRSTTMNFTLGCRELITEIDKLTPEFGQLVKAQMLSGDIIYGLICCVTIEDDAFVRQLVAAGVESTEIIEDQRQKRQVPVVVDVLIVGHGSGNAIYQRLPPQPPRALDPIFSCNNAEFTRFTADPDWLRIVLAAPDAPVDQLVVAALRAAAAARPPDQRELYLVGMGRELARLLSLDLGRLEGILKQLR
jgi:hypothetical protein